jgi:hypothetical protein
MSPSGLRLLRIGNPTNVYRLSNTRLTGIHRVLESLPALLCLCQAVFTFICEDGGGLMEELFSVEEVAQRLGGLSRWTIYAWISREGSAKRRLVVE